MKQIVIQSRKFGTHQIMVDDEDFNSLNKYSWHLCKDEERLYVYTNVRISYVGRKFTQKSITSFIIGERKGFVADHIDGNPLNNQRSNLRFCTESENLKNKIKRKIGKSIYKGVHPRYGKFRARIMNDYKCHDLGTFNTELEAAFAYNNAATKLHGKFANLNKI